MADSDDPFLPSGLRRSGRGPARAGGVATSRRRVRAAASASPSPSRSPPSARAFLGVGLNPLVQAASPLLLLTGSFAAASSPMDVAGAAPPCARRDPAVRGAGARAGVRNEIVLAARYALCAGLDEAVLSTPWGAQSEWAQHPLLVALHREAWGGEKFFEMLDRISADPARHIDLMELQYLVLALGFTGKYQMLDRGHEQLADLQHDLYRKIREQRGQPPPELSLRGAASRIGATG